MRYRKLTQDGDMTFGNGQIDFWKDQVDGVAQAVWTRLRLWTSEWYLNTASGTPYQDAVLGTNKKNTIEPAMRARILGTEGVTSIKELTINIDPENRNVSIFSEIDTEFGSVQIEGIQ